MKPFLITEDSLLEIATKCLAPNEFKDGSLVMTIQNIVNELATVLRKDAVLIFSGFLNPVEQTLTGIEILDMLNRVREIYTRPIGGRQSLGDGLVPFGKLVESIFHSGLPADYNNSNPVYEINLYEIYDKTCFIISTDDHYPTNSEVLEAADFYLKQNYRNQHPSPSYHNNVNDLQSVIGNFIHGVPPGTEIDTEITLLEKGVKVEANYTLRTPFQETTYGLAPDTVFDIENYELLTLDARVKVLKSMITDVMDTRNHKLQFIIPM